MKSFQRTFLSDDFDEICQQAPRLIYPKGITGSSAEIISSQLKNGSRFACGLIFPSDFLQILFVKVVLFKDFSHFLVLLKDYLHAFLHILMNLNVPACNQQFIHKGQNLDKGKISINCRDNLNNCHFLRTPSQVLQAFFLKKAHLFSKLIFKS